MKALIVILVLAVTSFVSTIQNQNGNIGILISGGEEAIPHEFPWQVSLKYQGTHFCGGIIYNSDTIITTAQCGDVASASSVKVLCGKHDLSLNESTQQESDVLTIARHPEYNSDKFLNDIAILKLKTHLQFNSNVSAISIAPKGHTATGDSTISGWGITKYGGSLSNRLQKVNIPIITDAECRAFYGADLIKDSMICAIAPTGEKNSCQGDTGGPFLANDLGSDYYLAGIVSWGYGCVGPNYPGVYTEVSYFHDFIENHS